MLRAPVITVICAKNASITIAFEGEKLRDRSIIIDDVTERWLSMECVRIFFAVLNIMHNG